MADGVFVSYRREDARSAAQIVHRTLVDVLGPERVFFDRQSIQGGSSWSDTIDGALASARVLVLVIGPRWLPLLTERVEAGGDDIHLKEIVAALDGGMDIYPVLVEGARPLADADLPPVLQGRLTARQWRVIHETTSSTRAIAGSGATCDSSWACRRSTRRRRLPGIAGRRSPIGAHRRPAAQRCRPPRDRRRGGGQPPGHADPGPRRHLPQAGGDRPRPGAGVRWRGRRRARLRLGPVHHDHRRAGVAGGAAAQDVDGHRRRGAGGGGR